METSGILSEFEIHERLAALDRKLELVARTERTIVDLISTRHSLRVEWYNSGCVKTATQLHCVPERSISLHSSFLNDRIERVVQLLEESLLWQQRRKARRRRSR